MMIRWKPGGLGWGGRSRGEVQQQRRTCCPRSGACPDGLQGVSISGPEATGWAVVSGAVDDCINQGFGTKSKMFK